MPPWHLPHTQCKRCFSHHFFQIVLVIALARRLCPPYPFSPGGAHHFAATFDPEPQTLSPTPCRAQEFAATYLSAEARTCYWLALLSQYGATLAYSPNISTWRYAKPAQQFIDEEIKQFDPGLYKETLWEP